jgi:hypothetical protein
MIDDCFKICKLQEYEGYLQCIIVRVYDRTEDKANKRDQGL